MSGQSCSDVRVLRQNPEAEAAGYARLSALYLLRDALPGVVPGIEGRAAVEQIGQTAEMQLRMTAFLSPVAGPLLSRFGIGVDAYVPLETNSDAEQRAWKLRDIRPFLLIGASL